MGQAAKLAPPPAWRGGFGHDGGERSQARGPQNQGGGEADPEPVVSAAAAPWADRIAVDRSGSRDPRNRTRDSRRSRHARAAARLNFGGLPFRVYPDIAKISPPTAADRSKTRTTARCESATAAVQIAGRLMEIAIASTCGLSRKENVVGPFRPSSNSGSRAGSSETPAHAEPNLSCLPFPPS